MKKILKLGISIVGVLFFSANIFYCTVAGAPENPKAAVVYIILAGIFSLLSSSFVCICFHYILYLQRKLEKKEKEGDQNRAA